MFPLRFGCSPPLTPPLAVIRALTRLPGVVCLAAVLAQASVADAQMVPGSRVVGEAPALGLDRDHQSRDFTIQEIACSAPANVLWPGDPASLTFRITNTTAAPLSANGVIEVIQYGTRGKPGDIWEPLFYQIATVDSVPIQVKDRKSVV